MPAPVLDQRPCIEVSGGVVVGGEDDGAPLDDFLALCRSEPGPQQLFGEIGGAGDANERCNALRARQRRQQHDPAAHARADEDLRTLGQRIDDGDGVLAPAPDCALGEIAARCAMAEIVEAQIGAPVATAIILEKQCLGSGHVGAEAAEEDDPRRVAREPVVGDCRAIGAC